MVFLMCFLLKIAVEMSQWQMCEVQTASENVQVIAKLD